MINQENGPEAVIYLLYDTVVNQICEVGRMVPETTQDHAIVGHK